MSKTDVAEATVLRLTRRFAAPREVIFRAWTRPEELALWFGPKWANARDVKVDLRPGGHYSLTLVDGDSVYPLSGIYREIRAPERLAFSWIWGHGDFAGVEMQVTIDLAETKDGGTLLTLTHERLPSTQARERHDQGWTSTLESLAAYIAKSDYSAVANRKDQQP